jgi:DnaJ domain
MAAEHDAPEGDLYQLLGVPRGASREEIAQAWRRRARAEHPDSRPCDTSATARFRVLAGAYEVLGDPARRAAYDRALSHDQPSHDQPSHPAPAPAARVPVRHRPGPRGPAGVPPLQAGPVWVEVRHPRPAVVPAGEAEARLAALAELAVRYLAGERGWPW